MSTSPVASEPLVTRASVVALLAALFYLLTEYGFDITSSQQAAILGVVAALAPLIAGVWARAHVTPWPAVDITR